MSKPKKSKSSLMLMEIVITVGLFMVCGSLCIQFFVNTHLVGKETKNLNNASVWIESALSVIEAYDEPMEGLSKSFPLGNQQANTYEIYYDKAYNICSGDNASYTLTLKISDDQSGCYIIDSKVVDIDGKEVYELITKKAYNFSANE